MAFWEEGHLFSVDGIRIVETRACIARAIADFDRAAVDLSYGFKMTDPKPTERRSSP